MRSPLLYFVDPVLRAPTVGSMLMCLAAALVGVIVFLRKQSLLGETLSHATYPGVIFGVVVAAYISPNPDEEALAAVCILTGAFIAALGGLYAIDLMERHLKIRSDSALCFVLSSFFGVGLTFASRVQVTHTSLYRKIQMYLYGQSATMTDGHIWLYGGLCILLTIVIVCLYKELQALNFDRDYARSIGISARSIEMLFFTLIVLAVVIGIRCVGVVLMSAMLIAPAAAARQYTHKLSTMLAIAAAIGAVSGFFGNYAAVEGSLALQRAHPQEWLALPTGPTIVLVAATICLFSLLFAPKRGLILRGYRILKFRLRCLHENLLKAIWRLNPEEMVPYTDIQRTQTASRPTLWFVLQRLTAHGWLQQDKGMVGLTPDGRRRAAQVVRLHRLWEVYLANYLGVGAERVHPNAEEMEHIITPELEAELTDLLKNPTRDPHEQPIPPKES